MWPGSAAVGPLAAAVEEVMLPLCLARCCCAAATVTCAGVLGFETLRVTFGSTLPAFLSAAVAAAPLAAAEAEAEAVLRRRAACVALRNDELSDWKALVVVEVSEMAIVSMLVSPTPLAAAGPATLPDVDACPSSGDCTPPPLLPFSCEERLLARCGWCRCVQSWK